MPIKPVFCSGDNLLDIQWDEGVIKWPLYCCFKAQNNNTNTIKHLVHNAGGPACPFMKRQQDYQNKRALCVQIA
jgi:hypothetical protein